MVELAAAEGGLAAQQWLPTRLIALCQYMLSQLRSTLSFGWLGLCSFGKQTSQSPN
jgi:hypothetical protein